MSPPGIKPFFTFYGGKWRSAPHYPKPSLPHIIEPFAGAAGYSLRYANRKVTLVEKDPVIAALWRYLINVSVSEINRLPTFLPHEEFSVDDIRASEHARTLIGFWLNKGTTRPSKSPGRWMRDGLRPKSFWGPEIRQRIASQVEKIRHWKIIEGSYEQAPSTRATWFVDPPYEKAGLYYRHSARDIDFAELAAWCKQREGQVIVCENDGAEWLPFKSFRLSKSTEGKHGKSVSKESIYVLSDIGI